MEEGKTLSSYLECYYQPQRLLLRKRMFSCNFVDIDHRINMRVKGVYNLITEVLSQWLPFPYGNGEWEVRILTFSRDLG